MPSAVFYAMLQGIPMGQLFDNIRQLVADEKYVVGQHGSESLEERGILEWQIVVGLDDGKTPGRKSER